MEINKVTVIGAGTMGIGIAQVIAQAGIAVTLYDLKEEIIVKGISTITKNLDRSVDKGKISSEAKETVLANITYCTDIALAAKESDLIIEAAVENMEIKKKIFAQLSSVCPQYVIFATNTSALSISELAKETDRPQNVIGLHFFNPVPVMKLAEIIRGMATSQETFEAAKELTLKIGKTPVEVAEAPGFVVNRLLIPMINEACYILMEGSASKEDIDNAMLLGANHPIGPLALADMVGIDVCLAIMETLYEEFGRFQIPSMPALKGKW